MNSTSPHYHSEITQNNDVIMVEDKSISEMKGDASHSATPPTAPTTQEQVLALRKALATITTSIGTLNSPKPLSAQELALWQGVFSGQLSVSLDAVPRLIYKDASGVTWYGPSFTKDAQAPNDEKPSDSVVPKPSQPTQPADGAVTPKPSDPTPAPPSAKDTPNPTENTGGSDAISSAESVPSNTPDNGVTNNQAAPVALIAEQSNVINPSDSFTMTVPAGQQLELNVVASTQIITEGQSIAPDKTVLYSTQVPAGKSLTLHVSPKSNP